MAEPPNMRSRMVDAAIEMIESGGESSVRLAEVATRVGVSQPAVYHHFENRSQLVTAAYVAWYERNLLTETPPVAMMATVRTREEFMQACKSALEWSLVNERIRARSIRVAVLGAAQTNPELRDAINDINIRFLTPVADNMRTAQENGWIRSDFDPMAIAFWLNGQITGRLVAEMTDGHIDMEAWNAVSLDVLMAFLSSR